jgi:hypothetical protein
VATVDPARARMSVAPHGNVLYNYLTTMDVGSTFIRVTRTAAPNALGRQSTDDSLLAGDFCQRKADRGGLLGWMTPTPTTRPLAERQTFEEVDAKDELRWQSMMMLDRVGHSELPRMSRTMQVCRGPQEQ